MGYLNSDDMLLPGTLAYIVKAFRENPNVDAVYGHRVFMDSQGFEIGRCILPPHHAETLKWADYIPRMRSATTGAAGSWSYGREL